MFSVLLSVARAPQFGLGLVLQLHLPHQAPAHEADDGHQKNHAARMPERLVPPRSQDLVLRQRGPDEQRIVGKPPEAVQARDAVLRRLDLRRADRPQGLVGPVEIGLQHVAPDHLGAERATGHHRAAVEDECDGARLADVEAVVEAGEEVDLDGGECDAAEAAVGVVDAPRHGNQQLAVGAALDRYADMRPAVVVLAMEDEVFALGVVQVLRPHLPRVHDPAAVLVVDVDRIELRERGHPHGEHLVKPLDGRRPRAVVLHTLDDADQRGVGLLDRVVRLLRHRARQVGRGDAHLPELDRTRLPAVPAVERNQREADDGHENRGPEGDGGSTKHYLLSRRRCLKRLADFDTSAAGSAAIQRRSKAPFQTGRTSKNASSVSPRSRKPAVRAAS